MGGDVKTSRQGDVFLDTKAENDSVEFNTMIRVLWIYHCVKHVQIHGIDRSAWHGRE